MKMKGDRFLKLIPYLQIGMLILLGIFIFRMNQAEKDSRAALETVEENVKASMELAGMSKESNRMFRRFYGLNPGDYEGVCFYAADSNMDAEELLIVKMKDNSQGEALTAAVEKRLQKQMESFEGYGAEQTRLLEKHVLLVRGNYLFYAVHKDAAKAKQAFLKSL